MFKMKIKGPWLNATRLLRNYPKRLSFVRRQIMKDMAEVLYSKLMLIIPDTPDYRQYKESLKVVEITGLPKSWAFAVVSDRDAVKLGDISVDEAMQTVVYIQFKGAGQPPELTSLVMQMNPWPVELVPNGLDRRTTLLVHRKVSEPEYKYVRQNTMEFISANKDMIQGVGGSWGKTEDTKRSSAGMKSLPDFMAFGLRSEFGIRTPSRPHWRPAVREVTGRLGEIIKADDTISKALYDWLFREHLSAPKSYEEDMDQDKFVKEAGEFQGKIAAVLGGELH